MKKLLLPIMMVLLLHLVYAGSNCATSGYNIDGDNISCEDIKDGTTSSFPQSWLDYCRGIGDCCYGSTPTYCGSPTNDCTNTATDLSNCGSCGTVCQPNIVCINDNQRIDPAICIGYCDTTTGTPTGCADDKYCITGSGCTGTCTGTMRNCNDNSAGCETNISTNVNHCGACNNACSTNRMTPVCSSGSCSGTCDANYGNCDSNFANGCETSLNTLTNCGACGNVCSAPNTNPSCIFTTSYSCSYECTGTYRNCNNNWADGCETNINTDPNNCGDCSIVCLSSNTQTRSCSLGVCSPTCTSGYLDCDKTENNNGCEINGNLDTTCGTACNSLENCLTKLSTGPTIANQFIPEKVTDFTSCSLGSCQSTEYKDTCGTENVNGKDRYYVRQWITNGAGITEAQATLCGEFGTVNYCATNSDGGYCDTCPSNQAWDGSSCKAVVCTPNEYSCSSATDPNSITYRRCNPTGTGYTTITTCPDSMGSCGLVTCSVTNSMVNEQATVCGAQAQSDTSACTVGASSGICCQGNCDTILENSNFDTQCRTISCSGTDARYSAANQGNSCGTPSNYCTTNGLNQPSNTHDAIKASCTLASCPDTQVFRQNNACNEGLCSDNDNSATTTADNDILIADCKSDSLPSGSCNPATNACECNADFTLSLGNCIKAYTEVSPSHEYPMLPQKPSIVDKSGGKIAIKGCYSKAAGYDCDVLYNKINQAGQVLAGG